MIKILSSRIIHRIARSAACLLALNLPHATAAAEKPNILFILADDLGWKDLGCTGSTFYETPALDALAKEGVRFSQAYAPHPVCGPSRCSLLSGRYPLRTNNTGVKGNLKLKETTFAEVFKKAGYRTLCIGKWHCGAAPTKQGFDLAIANHSQGQPGSYHFPYKDTGMDWPGKKRKVIKARDVPDLEDGQPGEYLTDRLTRETIRFIDQDSSAPFCIFLSHYAVHSPLESKAEYLEYFKKKSQALPDLPREDAYHTEDKTLFKQRQDNPVFAGMIKSLDDSVASLVNHLKEKGLYQNTIIIFSSDNGGIAAFHSGMNNVEFPTSNLPLRAGKGWCYDGGTRVPMIISYPGKTPAGQLIDTPVIGTDIFPTMLELSGQALQPEAHKDGVSLAGLIQGTPLKPRPLFWFSPQAHGSGHKPSAAMLEGDYKLIFFLKSDRVKLYNLKSDPGERSDLSGQQPERAERMKAQIQQWRKQMTGK